MTLSELKKFLDSSGIIFKYHHWETTPTLPFGVYFTPSSDNLKTDGKVAIKISNVIAEIYMDAKTPATETALENVLDNAGIFYNKTESYIDSEKMYQVSYEFQI